MVMRPWWLAPAQERGKEDQDTPEGCVGNMAKKDIIKINVLNWLLRPLNLPKKPKRKSHQRKLRAQTLESDSKSKAAFLVTYDSNSNESDDYGDGDWFDEIAMLDSEEKDWFSEGKVDEFIDGAHDVH